jgi:hypothetical protein
MKLQQKELDYLSAWAREEKAADPYALPAHQLQASHQVSGVTLIRLIKAWARCEGRRDEDIFGVGAAIDPVWPWSEGEFRGRVSEIQAGEPNSSSGLTPPVLPPSRK